MKYFSILLIVFCLAGCRTTAQKTMVLDYNEFGPQVASYQTIGYSWWQWDHHGDSRDEEQYDVRIVVYRGMALEDVKRAYPVVKEAKQDYRYLHFADAIVYLEETIDETEGNENVRMVAEACRKTKAKLMQGFGAK